MKICAQIVLAMMTVGCFTIVTERPVVAQVVELESADELDTPRPGKRGGYIRDFLNQRSGEEGIGGFVLWMFSYQKWIDIYRYMQQFIKLEDSLNPGTSFN